MTRAPLQGPTLPVFWLPACLRAPSLKRRPMKLAAHIPPTPPPTAQAQHSHRESGQASNLWLQVREATILA